jgi:hypothetical protein
MARFTVRVELHQANEDDYDLLHHRMEERGFSRQITGNDGVTYHLPPAEYNFISSDTAEVIRDKVLSIAKTVKPKPGILVTQGARAWTGLVKVD